MKCPQCNSEMVDGKTKIGGGGMTLLSGGLPFATVVFKADKWSEHVMQETSDVLPAHYCDKCGTIVTETNRRGLSTLES